MTQKALKLALEALERYQIKRQDFDTFVDVITAIKEALAQDEQSSSQEPVAIELALAGLVEKITGGFDSGDLLADAVTASKMLDAQPKQPISVQPEQEPVQKRPQNCGSGYCSCIECVMELEQEPSITKTGFGILTLHVGFDDLPDGTKFYITPPKRPWVGLTDAPTYTEQQIANACWAAEISDSKCESLLIALQEAAHNIGVKP